MMLWKCCTQYASKFGKLSSGHRTGKSQFSFQSQRRAIAKNIQTTIQLCSFHIVGRESAFSAGDPGLIPGSGRSPGEVYLEPDILECKVKWALGSITMNKASGGDGIPVELFQILKDHSVKVLYSVTQQIWNTQQWPQDWKRSVFIPIPKKGNGHCTTF